MNQIGPLVRIRAVQPRAEFKVHLTFANGVEKEVDLRPYLRGPIFEPIRNDPTLFRSVSVVGSTIGWIDPDVLYYNLKPAWMEQPEARTQSEPITQALIAEPS